MDQKELREQENRCIQEHAPACMAACPAHVDGRALAAEIAKGDYVAAYLQFRKAVPFPEIISRICDQPCQSACLRKDLGGSIEIGGLERACVEYGALGAEAIKPLPRKSKKVAVIGAGISGMTAAFDLARKGWGVVVFEARSQIGGRLCEILPEVLPDEVLRRSLGSVALLGVEIRLNMPIGLDAPLSLSALCSEYDAVFLAAGASCSNFPDLRLTEDGRISVDALTFQTSLEKVFAGGDILQRSTWNGDGSRGSSAIHALSEGRRAATSIDRFLQNVSLTAARFNEGTYVTRLFTNTTGVPHQNAFLSRDPAARAEQDAVRAEAERCIQCECMECVKVCEYLQHYKGYPKKYIREIYNNLSIVMGTRHSNQFINSCSLCGLCAEVCPTDVDMGAICKEARGVMVDQKRMPPSAHEFALEDMAFSNGAKFSLARNAPGFESSDFLFFPGCQLSATSPEYVVKMYEFLQGALSPRGVGLMLRCCGAPADWAGRKDLFSASRDEFLSEHEKLGSPRLVLACSSCYQVFKSQFPGVEITSFWTLMDELGPQQFSGARHPVPMAIHDPCSTRYESHIQDAIRRILQKMGCDIRELPFSREKTECCSYGGLMWLANRTLAEQSVQRRLGESPHDYITYCAMCRDFFSRRGKRTLHVLDLIFGSPETDPALVPAVGFSQRRENRARLKARLLKNIWSETMPEQKPSEAIRLYLPEMVQKMVEERLILMEDIQQVIETAERTGQRMFNPGNGHYLASYKPNHVTYWVDYSPQGDGFLVHNAYSHRMEIGLGG